MTSTQTAEIKARAGELLAYAETAEEFLATIDEVADLATAVDAAWAEAIRCVDTDPETEDPETVRDAVLTVVHNGPAKRATTAAKPKPQVVDQTVNERFDKAAVGQVVRTNECQCGLYSYDTEDGGAVGTDCPWLVRSSFRQGHDATLKSLLIRAGAAGVALSRRDAIDTGNRIVTSTAWDNARTTVEERIVTEAKYEPTTAIEAAARYGFEALVAKGIANAQAKAAAKVAREAARAAEPKVSRRKAAPKFTAVRVGRWSYEVASAKVKGDQAEVTYATKSGETKTVTVPVGNLS